MGQQTHGGVGGKDACNVVTRNTQATIWNGRAGETNLKIKNCFSKTAGKHLADELKEFAEDSVIR